MSFKFLSYFSFMIITAHIALILTEETHDYAKTWEIQQTLYLTAITYLVTIATDTIFKKIDGLFNSTSKLLSFSTSDLQVLK